jgi:hypothetical protein
MGRTLGLDWKEKKHRVEDALQATRAALEEGIVPGGGVALLQAASAVSISDNGASVDGSDDERTGARIVLRALEEPLRQLAENAGLEGSVVVNDVRKAKKGFGLNADMSGIPPPPAAAPSFSGSSATIASVVRMFLAIDAAFCSAERVTIAGSITPPATRSTISLVEAGDDVGRSHR